MELDHVFVCVDDASAAEQALADFGLQFSVHAVHQGQGTANACAFFENAYLELLWRHDDHELRSEVVRPLALWERVRWRHTGASPFGLAFGLDVTSLRWIPGSTRLLSCLQAQRFRS